MCKLQTEIIDWKKWSEESGSIVEDLDAINIEWEHTLRHLYKIITHWKKQEYVEFTIKIWGSKSSNTPSVIVIQNIIICY